MFRGLGGVGVVRHFIDNYLTGETFDLRKIKNLYIPVWMEQLSVNLASMLNSIFVASASASVFAAVSLVETINMFVMSVFIALATGGAVVVSQYVGKQDKENVEESVVQVMISTTLFSAILGIVIYAFKDPITSALFGGVDDETMANIRIYLTVCCASYPFSGFLNSGIAVLRGSGKTKASARLVILTAILNFCTSITFIKILNWGLFGLMFNLVLVRVIGVLWAFYYVVKVYPDILKSLKELSKWNVSMQKRIVSIGIPTALEQMFFNGGKMLIQTFVVSMGTSMVVVNAISNSITNILFLPGNAVCLCATTIIGTCIGAGKKDEARKMAIGLIGFSWMLITIVSIVSLPILPFVVKLYTSIEAESTMAVNIILIAIAGNVTIWPWSFVLPAGMRSAGDVKNVTLTAFFTMWAFRVVLGYLLGITLGFGLYGVYTAMVIEWTVRALLFYIRFRHGKWLEKRVV